MAVGLLGLGLAGRASGNDKVVVFEVQRSHSCRRCARLRFAVWECAWSAFREHVLWPLLQEESKEGSAPAIQKSSDIVFAFLHFSQLTTNGNNCNKKKNPEGTLAMAHASKGASVRRLSWRHWAQWADGISPWKKQVPGLCLTAALNIMDFYSDLLVVLKYGCYVEGSFTRSCGWEEVAQVALATCQPHWWWFRIGLAMLVVSNTEQSAVWAHFMALQAPPGWRGWRRVCAFAGAFMLAFFQLNYLVDVACLVYRGRRADKAGEIYTESQSESFNRAFRELVTKCLESAPQLYFQTYVLFTLGAHRDWVQAGSVAISTLSLAYGITKVWAASPIRFQSGEHLHRRLKTPRALLLIFLFLTLDQAWRAGVAALMLAEASRPIGVVVLVAFLLGFLICFMLNWRDFCKEFCHSEANLIQLFFLPIAATLAGHLMPAVLILVDELADGESMLRTASPQLLTVG